MTTTLHPTKAIGLIMPLLLCLVMSFDAGAQDYSITSTGNVITITDLSGHGDNLSVFQSGAGLGFMVVPDTRTYSLNGGPVTAFSIPPDALNLADVTGITLNTAAGNDIIDLQAFTTNLPGLTINGGFGDDSVTFKGNINFAANANLDLDMQNDNASPGIDKVKFETSANLVLSGTGAATIKVSKNVIFQKNNLLRTTDGDLTIEANQQAIPAPGNFIGIHLMNNVTVETTGNGVTTFKGRGGKLANNNIGIEILQDCKVSCGVTGMVSITGTGGPSTGTGNNGVSIIFAGSMISSLGGNVSVTGQGNGIGASFANIGIELSAKAQISAGGSGTVTVNGTGGNSENSTSNHGLYISFSASISSSGGNVTVTGQGGGSAGSYFSNFGIWLRDQGQISAGGSGTVTVKATGGTGFFGCYGLYIEDPGSSISSSGGNISVTGQGGINSSTSKDIELASGGMISASGTGADIELTGSVAGIFPSTGGTDVATSDSKTIRFGSNSKLNMDIDGITVNSQYQQLAITGMIDLSNARLTFTGSSLVPVGGQTFTIVANDGADQIAGNFVGLPEGAIISNFLGSPLNAAITYVGGDGNDAVLTVLSPCAGPTIPTLTLTENPVCSGSPTTLSIQTGDLNDATNWQWYSGSCGGTPVGSGNAIIVSPTSTITYYARGEGGCVSPGICASITITVNNPQTWYLDADNDGHYLNSTSSCTSPGEGYNTTATESGDCNDNDIAIWQSASLYIDNDGDGFDDEQATVCYGSAIPEGYIVSTSGADCDDNDAGKWQSANLYIDNDGDGYDNGQVTVCYGLAIPMGYSATTSGSDCNDNETGIHVAVQFYIDADHDGYGSATTAMVCSSTAPIGYSTNNTDCNDADGTVHAPVQYYVDADQDGFGSTTTTMVCSSTAPVGYSTNNTDCNDNDGAVHEGNLYYVDADQDGYGSTTTAMVCSATAPIGYSINNTDCNDNDAGVHEPQQYYVDVDQDGFGSTTTAMFCSSTAPVGYSTNNTDCNDADGTVHAPVQYYVDADHDGYGSTTTAMFCSSTAPVGYSTNNTDCNDVDGTVHTPVQYYVDADHDGYGSTTTAMVCSSTAPVGYSTNNTDCNDADGTVHEPQQYYVDADHDGFGSTTTAMVCLSTAPVGYSTNNTDCNDNNAAIKPTTVWYKDADNDNYSDGTTQTQCARPSGYKLSSELTATSGDCNDANAGTKPGAVEICGNSIDDNCNGQVDENCSSCVNVTVSTTTISCYGGLATITVYASNGKPPYKYKLSGGLSFQLNNNFIVGAGTYSVTVMDKTGCTKTISNIVINQPAPLTLTLVQKTDVSCRNGSNGKIVVSAGGGTGAYSYKLNSGSYKSSGTFQNLKAGKYTVTAKDAKGCTKSISVTIKNGTGSCNAYALTGKTLELLDGKLTPNPTVNEFRLQVSGNSSEPVNIRVVDIFGKTRYITKGAAGQSYKFGQHFAAGVYIIEIMQGANSKIIKAIKQ